MDYNKFLNKVIDNGIAAAKKDYTHKDQAALLRGSIAGFEACRGKTAAELAEILKEAKEDSFRAYLKRPDLTDEELEESWEKRGYESEVGWVCNVVSALLANEGKQTIGTPTARGTMMAAKVVGVKEELAGTERTAG